VESPYGLSKTREDSEELISLVAGGDPGTVSNFVLVHIDCGRSRSGEVRRSIGGRFLAKGESEASWGI